MNRARLPWFSRASLLLLSLVVSACHRAPEHTHEHEEAPLGATFKEGHGIALLPETLQILGLQTASVEERTLSREIELTARVFDAGPPVLASAAWPAAQVDVLVNSQVSGARLVRIDRHGSEATGLVDLVLGLEKTNAKLGEFVRPRLTFGGTAPTLAIPRAALLRTASGTFVYVANGGYYVRTPVSVGVQTENFLEITDGLYAGDEVVTRPVEQLWLIELRAVKGGGHSH